MSRSHLHYCSCGTAIRCTAPIIHEDSGSHCANVGPGEPVICAECAGEDDDTHDTDEAAAAAGS